MKRFANLFVYETTNFYGRYRNCKLLEDIRLPSGHIYALTGEVFPTILVDLDNRDISFFEEFDDHIPIITIKFKLSVV